MWRLINVLHDRLRPAIVLLLAMASSAWAQQAHERHHYYLAFDETLTQLDVRACFADGLPDRLVADHPLALHATTEFRYRTSERQVTVAPSSYVLPLPRPSIDGCIAWRVDLDRIAATNRLNVGYRAGDSLILAPATWLWRPPVLTANRDIEFDIDLPADMQISVPWQPLDDTDGRRYLHGHMPLDWPGLMAVGKLQRDDFEVPGARIRLAITDGPATADPVRTRRWLRAGALAVTRLWGEFPVDEDVQLLVIPWHEGRDAAPWAQTNRGGGPAVHLFMNAAADWPTLRDDWIATHEMVHLALPFVWRTDAWLPEGFASYYQHVLRARLGLVSAETAWQALHDGFLRGNRDTADDTLQEDSRQMHVRGRTLRVYWTGAAIALQADVALREQTAGTWSLDRVLQEFNRCCRKPERTWRGRELFEKFDEIAGSNIFIPLYEAHVHSRHFPRMDGTWSALGIDAGGKRLRVEENADDALRDAIMAPRN